jgi:hypothetical protein
MMENKTNVETTQTVQLPEGCFCGHNCADGCIYWNPYDRDSNGASIAAIIAPTTTRVSARAA